jgi:predicted AAA+ superfamily ATPase
MFERSVMPRVIDALAASPVTLVNGARQTGKSTLARLLVKRGLLDGYFSLDDAQVRAAALADPDGFVASLPPRAVIDEVQHAPDLFRAIKQSVDADRRPGRFLLTGSANVLLLPRISESLAGRMIIHTLWPLSVGETLGTRESFVDSVFEQAGPSIDTTAVDVADLRRRVIAGGFPQPHDMGPSDVRDDWFASYISAVVQKDVRDLSEIEHLAAVPVLLRLLAARIGGIVNVTEVSRSTGMPVTTVKRYLTLLRAAFILQFVEAWSGSTGKRMVKAPKAFPVDSGLTANLLRVDERTFDARPEIMGSMLEAFVGMELVKQISWSRTRPALMHFRSHAGQEVDYVLEGPMLSIVGVEVKASQSLGQHDFRGMRALADTVGSRFHRGYVLYLGETIAPFGPGMWAMPVSALWRPA